MGSKQAEEACPKTSGTSEAEVDTRNGTSNLKKMPVKHGMQSLCFQAQMDAGDKVSNAEGHGQRTTTKLSGDRRCVTGRLNSCTWRA